MAKLYLRGRREWVRARRVDQANGRQVVESVRVYMSDGQVMQKQRVVGKDWQPWRRVGTYDVVRPLAETRRQLEALGWTLCLARIGHAGVTS